MRQGCRGLVLICRLVVEAVLGHTSGSRAGIVGIYQRHDFANEKRAALEAWGKQVMALVEGSMRKRPTPEDARAMAILWLRRGEAVDLIGPIKANPNDSRNREILKAEAAIAKLEEHIERWDFTAATKAAFWLDGILFNLRAMEAVPFVRLGRKQHASLRARSDAHNTALHRERAAEHMHWNAEAEKIWWPGATKNAAARLF